MWSLKKKKICTRKIKQKQDTDVRQAFSHRHYSIEAVLYTKTKPIKFFR